MAARNSGKQSSSLTDTESNGSEAVAGDDSPTGTRLGSPLPYEERLQQDPRWALSEGSRHFEEKSKVFLALKRIAARLDELEIPYAIVGGMALFRHGYRRFTEDVDILVTKEDLKEIHTKLEGLGYLPPHRHSKNLRDTELAVRIEFLTTGGYPGDGKPKPVAFPDPRDVRFESDGIAYVKLPTLIELKLASGISDPGRLRDLADVREVIKVLNLPLDFVDQLNPYVREKFAELWKLAKTRYVTVWRKKGLSSGAKSIDETIKSLRAASDRLDAMLRDGVLIDTQSPFANDSISLWTTDPEVAKKYDMVDEAEFWGGDEDHRPDSQEAPPEAGC
jgi:hypothetical protein